MGLPLIFTAPSLFRDVVDATMNYAAHVSFVKKCLANYANEGKLPNDLHSWHTKLTNDHPYRNCTTYLRRNM